MGRLPETEGPIKSELLPNTTILDFPALTTFVAANPVLTILNKKTLERKFGNGEKFLPNLFEPPHVVDVTTADGVKQLIVDGCHRTFVYFKSNKGADPKEKFPDFNFTIKNVTGIYLDDPDIVPPTNEEKPKVLTPEQYAKILVPPTEEQAEVSLQRKTAHTMDIWKHLVGEETAYNFPAFFALGFLDTLPEEAKKDMPTLQEYTHSFFSDTFPTQEMIRLQETITNLQLKTKEIRNEAFKFIATQLRTDEGRAFAKQQLESLFLIPAIQQKFRDNSEVNRTLLHLTTVYFKLNLEIPQHTENTINTIFDAFIDPNITHDKIDNILQAKDSSKKYEQYKKKHIIAEATSKYKKGLAEKRPLSSLEETLLNKQVPLATIDWAYETFLEAQQILPDLTPEQAEPLQKKINQLLSSSASRIVGRIQDVEKELDLIQRLNTLPKNEIDIPDSEWSQRFDEALAAERELPEVRKQLSKAEAKVFTLEEQLNASRLLVDFFHSRIESGKSTQENNWEGIDNKQLAQLIKNHVTNIFDEKSEGKIVNSFKHYTDHGVTTSRETVEKYYGPIIRGLAKRVLMGPNDPLFAYFTAKVYLTMNEAHIEKAKKEKSAPVEIYRKDPVTNERIFVRSETQEQKIADLENFQTVLQASLNDFANEHTISPTERALIDLCSTLFTAPVDRSELLDKGNSTETVLMTLQRFAKSTRRK